MTASSHVLIFLIIFFSPLQTAHLHSGVYLLARAVAATQPIWAAGWHSPRSPERCRRGNSRSLFGREARCGPAPGGQLSLLGGGGGCAPLCGQRPLQLGGSASGVQGLRQPAGTPGPRSPKHRWPGAFISHPVLFPQIHRLRPPSPSSSPASPRVITDRFPLSLSLSLSLFPSRFKLSPRRKQHSGAARPAFHRPGDAAAAGALKTKRRTVTFHTVPFPPRAE